MRCASSTILMLLFPLVQTFTLLSPSLSRTSPIATSTSLSSLPLQVAASAVTYTTLVFAYDRPRGSLFVDLGEDVIIRDSNIPGAGKVRGWEGEVGSGKNIRILRLTPSPSHHLTGLVRCQASPQKYRAWSLSWCSSPHPSLSQLCKVQDRRVLRLEAL